MKIARTYSLEWLDALVSVTLNPERPYRQKLKDSDIALLLEKVPAESLQVQLELTARLFALTKESHTRHLARKYHNTLLLLHASLSSYYSHSDFRPEELLGLDALTLDCLTALAGDVEKRFGVYLRPDTVSPADDKTNQAPAAAPSSAERQKVLCTLSADQIALILRGADEAQVIKARSMNAVFKAIVPFLSTEHRENLSADSVRSKAYNPEEADRDAAISALQAIIRKIKSY
jgi:hypothetical protein